MEITANSHTVAGYLDLFGIGYKRVSETVTLLGFNVDATFYKVPVPLEIRTSPHWITFRALLVNNLSEKEIVAVALYLGYLNSQCRGVRYTLFETSVFITTEVHASRLGKESFAEALSAMVSSASKTTLGLRVLATNPKVAEFYVDLYTKAGVRTQALTPDDILIRFDLRPTGLEKLLKREVIKDDTERR